MGRPHAAHKPTAFFCLRLYKTPHFKSASVLRLSHTRPFQEIAHGAGNSRSNSSTRLRTSRAISAVTSWVPTSTVSKATTRKGCRYRLDSRSQTRVCRSVAQSSTRYTVLSVLGASGDVAARRGMTLTPAYPQRRQRHQGGRAPQKSRSSAGWPFAPGGAR